jgi:hypothetical protein
MNDGNATRSNRLLSAKFLTGLALATFLAVGAVPTPSVAQDDHHDHDRDRDRDHDRDRHDDRRGGYYAAPPVVYGTPYYPPPPVIYGPGIGINLPGVAIGIR